MSNIEQVDEICIMFLTVLPIYEDVIIDREYSWALSDYVIHPHLQDILTHFKSEWDSKKVVPTKMGVEHHQ